MQVWIIAAVGSALFAGLTAIFAKCGVKSCDSDVATALRTTVVLAFSWLMAAITVPDLPAALAAVSPRAFVFLALSGLATGASWVCYFKALAAGDVNKVVPIDKSSAALSALLAIVLFGETGNLLLRLLCIAAIFAGTLLMVEKRGKKGDAEPAERSARPWLIYALLSAIFAAVTSVLAKVGVQNIDSNLATALRTCVVLVMAWGIVVVRGKLSLARTVSYNELGFLVLSDIATGASWLLYYYAIQTGQVSVVVQIDKLSILVSVAFSCLVLGEYLSRRAAAGLALMTIATLVMTVLA